METLTVLAQIALPGGDQLPNWAIFALFLLAWLSREGVGAYLSYRKSSMEEERADDDRYLSGYKLLIGELKARVSVLEEARAISDAKYEKELHTLRAEHVGCLEKQAAMTATVARLEAQVEALWRHDQNNKANVKVIQEELAKRSD